MNAHVAVFTEDAKLFEELKRAADPTLFILQLNPPLNEIKEDHFIIADQASFLDYSEHFERINKNNLYVLSYGTDEDNMDFIQRYRLHHLVGVNPGIFANEVISNLNRTFTKRLWGLQNYLGPSADLKILSLSDSKNINEIVLDTLKQFNFEEYFSSPAEYVQVMANELISNSLYKGPNKKRAELGLDTPDRKSPVFLKGAELVQVSLGMDEAGLMLSVQDSFGGLNYDLLIQSLKRSFDEKIPMEKKDGAGLGLYLTFLHSNQFIVNFKENYRTEVICIIEKNKRYKNYKQRIRSFHFFHEVPSEKTNHK